MYDRIWNIRKQCEQRGCIAVHAFWVLRGMCFFIQIITQMTINDMECWYVMVEYSLVVASIFSFKTMGQWEHWDYYTASTFCISCNIVFAVG